MNHPLQALRYQTKVGMLLALLLCGLLINSFLGQNSYDHMQRDVKAMFEDRLLPATFLYSIREHLYQEQVLQASGRGGDAALQAHRQAIDHLVARYGQTRLTPEEAREWRRFLAHLDRFRGHPAGSTGGDYAAALASLSRLNAIQAGVGRHLENSLTAATGSLAIRSYLEMTLLIVVGAVTLSLIGSSRNVFYPTLSHRPSLN